MSSLLTSFKTIMRSITYTLTWGQQRLVAPGDLIYSAITTYGSPQHWKLIIYSTVTRDIASKASPTRWLSLDQLSTWSARGHNVALILFITFDPHGVESIVTNALRGKWLSSITNISSYGVFYPHSYDIEKFSRKSHIPRLLPTKHV